MTEAKFIQFQVSPEEKQVLEQLAQKDGRTSVSALLRKLIYQEAQRAGIVSQEPHNNPVK